MKLIETDFIISTKFLIILILFKCNDLLEISQQLGFYPEQYNLV